MNWLFNVIKKLFAKQDLKKGLHVNLLPPDEVTEPPPPLAKKLKLFRPVAKEFPVSSPFGWRDKPTPKYHKGIDFACPEGTPVKAMIGGIIYKVGWEKEEDHSQGYGLRVWQKSVYDDMNLYLWYGHMSKINIVPGINVNAGDVLGLSGNTGSSTGAHLHVGLREKNTRHFFDMTFYE